MRIGKSWVKVEGLLRNYVNVIFQNTIRNKTYSLINIVGLSVGLAAFIVILKFIRFEQSYDRFHTKADQLYRVILEFSTSTGGKLPIAHCLLISTAHSQPGS
jgi:putative ABC transport system permease protein